MKNRLFALVTALCALSLFSCAQNMTVRGNGIMAEKIISFNSDYSELRVSSGIVVVLSGSEQDRAVITADQMVMDYISVSEVNGRVRICYNSNVNIRSDIKTTIILPHSKNISHISASSSGVLKAAELILSPSLTIDCSSAAKIEARIEARDLRINISSSAECLVDALFDKCDLSASSAGIYRGSVMGGNLNATLSSSAKSIAKGKCDRLKLSTSSGGSFEGYELKCDNVYVNASSGSSANVYAVDELEVSASSGALIRYKGSPRLALNDISSGGSVKDVN